MDKLKALAAPKATERVYISEKPLHSGVVPFHTVGFVTTPKVQIDTAEDEPW